MCKEKVFHCGSPPSLTGRKAFTIIELVVVIVLISFIAALVLTVASSVRSKARTVQCSSNIRQISLAMDAFYADHIKPPSQNWKEELAPYLKDNGVLLCPDALSSEDDSYSQFFINRPKQNTRELIFACPRHGSCSQVICLVAPGTVRRYNSGKIMFEDKTIFAGDKFHDGTLTLEDGSTAKSKNGFTAMAMTSFYGEDGSLHSVLKVDHGQTGTLEIHVEQHGLFEVVMPNMILQLTNGDYTISQSTYNDTDYIFIDAQSGTVTAQGASQSGGIVINTGDGKFRGLVNALWRELTNRGNPPDHNIHKKVQMILERGGTIDYFNGIKNIKEHELLILEVGAVDTAILGWLEYFGRPPLEEGIPHQTTHSGNDDDSDDNDNGNGNGNGNGNNKDKDKDKGK